MYGQTKPCRYLATLTDFSRILQLQINGKALVANRAHTLTESVAGCPRLLTICEGPNHQHVDMPDMLMCISLAVSC